MIRNDTWKKIRSIWPENPTTGWDHWLRHGSGLRPRECVVPEVPRTFHFGDQGTNVKKGSPLHKMLESMAVSSLAPGLLGDTSYLLQDVYEAQLNTTLFSALQLEPDAWRGGGDALNKLERGQMYKLAYLREDYPGIAKVLQLYPGQPRTAHHGIVLTAHAGTGATVALIDRRQGRGFLFEKDLVPRHADLRAEKANPGESCTNACLRLGLECDNMQLEFLNSCEALKLHFPCEKGCGHQVGLEIPCYVHDKYRDTSLQCLVTDNAASKCGAKHIATTRLCACVPKSLV